MKGKPALTPAQIAQARRLWNNGDGLTIAALSRRFGVGRDVIDNIVTKHIEYEPVNFTTDAHK